jgi:peroxiredoxin
MGKIRGVLIGVAVVGILLIRYVGEPSSIATAQSTKNASTPDFKLTDSNGASIHLSDYKGKVVLLNFWATWCGPCNIEIPWFVEFENRYRNRGFVVLGVSMDEEGWKVVRPFMENRKINYPVLLGNEDLAQHFGNIESLPTTFLIDRTGKIATVHTGLVGKDAYAREISQLLGN